MQEESSRSFPVSTRVRFDHVFYLGFRLKIAHISAIIASVLVLMLVNGIFIKEFRTESLRWSHVMRLVIMQSLLMYLWGRCSKRSRYCRDIQDVFLKNRTVRI